MMGQDLRLDGDKARKGQSVAEGYGDIQVERCSKQANERTS
jgi:hypothetical protein